MDAKLEYNKEIHKIIRTDFQAIENQIGIQFYIWQDIPTEFLQSYFENEISINPVRIEFEVWMSNLKKRLGPLYSVAIEEKRGVIASVYSGITSSQRFINLWHVNENFRGRSIGKAVLLNCINNLLEHSPETPIVAWDITSRNVMATLVQYGFVATK